MYLNLLNSGVFDFFTFGGKEQKGEIKCIYKRIQSNYLLNGIESLKGLKNGGTI